MVPITAINVYGDGNPSLWTLKAEQIPVRGAKGNGRKKGAFQNSALFSIQHFLACDEEEGKHIPRIRVGGNKKYYPEDGGFSEKDAVLVESENHQSMGYTSQVWNLPFSSIFINRANLGINVVEYKMEEEPTDPTRGVLVFMLGNTYKLIRHRSAQGYSDMVCTFRPNNGVGCMLVVNMEKLYEAKGDVPLFIMDTKKGEHYKHIRVVWSAANKNFKVVFNDIKTLEVVTALSDIEGKMAGSKHPRGFMRADNTLLAPTVIYDIDKGMDALNEAMDEIETSWVYGEDGAVDIAAVGVHVDEEGMIIDDVLVADAITTLQSYGIRAVTFVDCNAKRGLFADCHLNYIFVMNKGRKGKGHSIRCKMTN